VSLNRATWISVGGEEMPEQESPRRPITAEDVMRLEVLLAIAGILTLLAGVGFPDGSVTEIIIGLIMIYSAIVSLGYITILKDVFPAESVAAVTGVILFFLNLEWLTRYTYGRGWAMGLGLIAGLIAIFAAILGYLKSR
jgi:hypothetical protein